MKIGRFFAPNLVLVGSVVAVWAMAQQRPAWSPDIPKTWDEAALKDWAIPIATLGDQATFQRPIGSQRVSVALKRPISHVSTR